MKTRILIWYTFLTVGCLTGRAQNPENPAKGPVTLEGTATRNTPTVQNKEKLPVFDIEFSGGTPARLVEAIQKQSPRPVNVVLPFGSDSVVIPAFSMHGITVDQLFQALMMASQHVVSFRGGGLGPAGRPNMTTMTVNYGFRTEDRGFSSNPVWYFYYNAPPTPEGNTNQLRYFNLTRFLESYSVEDITTAIQTGWKMLHLDSQPTLSFHKETGLLIAVGAPEHLLSIDETLNELEKGLIKRKMEEKANEQLKK